MDESAPSLIQLDYATPARKKWSGHAWLSLIFAAVAPVIGVLWCWQFWDEPAPGWYSRDFEGALRFITAFTINYFCPIAAVVYGISAIIRILLSRGERHGIWLALLGIAGGILAWLFIETINIQL